ncbi:unnamed protein product [Prorocentrum cordatum]|uniref:Uncharacterized protein n=1 Tax=Prorocentrum cordatum TaxID=2364126 RepID=A0ABN9SB39_9DINO|nr:unnamed protein product [Polarella glacialis]
MPLLIDEAMGALKDKDMTYSELDAAAVSSKAAGDIDGPIDVGTFTRGALRKLGEVRVTRSLFDVVEEFPMPENLGQVMEQIAGQTCTDVPPALRPGAELPEGTKYSVVVGGNGNGAAVAVKIYAFQNQVPLKTAQELVIGTGYAPIARKGPWLHKKTLQWLLDRIPGHRVDWASVEEKQRAKPTDGEKKRWEATDEELEEGIDFINKHAPAVNDMNQQWLFIEKNIKPSSGSKIAGWPWAKVANAVHNRAKAATGCAKVERSFPLCVFDLHPLWPEVLLPCIFPLLSQFGLLFFGLPGIGKTPTFIVLAMAMGRYTAARSGARCLAENEFDEKGEPPADDRTIITAAEAEKLFMKPFSGWKQAHVLAVLKRAVARVAAVVHRISFDNIEKDWLRDKQYWGNDNKKYYNLYKQGMEVFYDNFDEQLQREQDLIDRAATARGDKLADAYIAECNESLQAKLLSVMELSSRLSAAPPRPEAEASDGASMLSAAPPSPEAEASGGAIALHVRPDGDGSYVFPTGPPAPRTSTKRSRCRIDGVGAREVRPRGSPPSLVEGQPDILAAELGAMLEAEGLATQPGVEASPQALSPSSPPLFPPVGMGEED